MPSVIDPETMNVDDLPGIWSPVQWDLSEEERLEELHQQATASLLMAVDSPEAILRMLLEETEIEQAFEPPDGYKPREQGNWDPDLITFQFKHRMKLISTKRERNYLQVIFDFEDLGRWMFEIQQEEVNIRRI